MSDLHQGFSALPREQPGNDEAREARHQVLATLLGAFADDELPAETASQIDAHLLGCVRCRREVEVHVALRERLSREHTPALSSAFRDRVATQLLATPRIAEAANAVVPAHRSARSTRALAGVALLALALISGAIVWQMVRRDEANASHSAAVNTAAVPLLLDVLADYRRVTAGDLPGRSRDLDAVRAAVPFPIEPLRDPSLRLLAAWSTDLLGEPAAVLAYRWHDRLLLQYLVAESQFFRHPAMREAIARGGVVTATEGRPGLAAWVAAESGMVLIADTDANQLAALRVGGSGR
jgi:anti-sigma factor RsiW